MYGRKYTTSYKRFSNNTTTIDILERDYAGAVTELTPTDDPLNISYSGDAGNIFEPTLGSGATIKVYATPLTLLGLFTDDPQKYMVKIYNGATGVNLFWQGFVNTEIYSEDYSSSLPVQIQLQCNDGMQVLDNIAYRPTATTFYTGVASVGTIFTQVLAKLGISFTYIYTSNDISVSAGVTNIFTGLKLAQENFVDESDKVMSCRAVLQSVIGGLGLVVRFKGGNIYIIDPINLHSTSKGKRYATSDYSETSSAFGGYLDIHTGQVKWYETGSQLDIVPSVFEATVKYDPYNFYESTYNFANLANWSTVGTWSGSAGYYSNTGVVYKDWTGGRGIGVKEQNTSAPEFVLTLNDSGTVLSYTYPHSNITQDANLQLKLSMDVFVQTKEDSTNIFSTGTSKDVYQVKIPISVKVGSQYWQGYTSWTNSVSRQSLVVREAGVSELDYAKSKINDTWTNASVIVPLSPSNEGTLINGDISVEILDTLNIADILPASQSYFTASASGGTLGWGSGVTPTYSNTNAFSVSISSFKSKYGLPSNRKLFTGAIKNLTIGSFGLLYYNQSQVQTAVTSGSFTVQSVYYDGGTDVLTFNIVKDSGSFFTNFDHFAAAPTGALMSVGFNYDYQATNFLIKNVKAEIVNSSTGVNIGNTGVEETGTMNTNFTGKSATTINTTAGTGTSGCSRGAFKNTAGTNLSGMVRDGNTRTTSKLILQSYVSQYHTPRFKLSGTLDAVGKQLDLITYLITDTAHLSGKAFYITGGSYNDRDEAMSVDMIELTSTRDTI